MIRPNGYLPCPYCSRYFPTKIGFKNHQNNEHKQEEEYSNQNSSNENVKQLEINALLLSIADQHAKPTESVNLEAKESIVYQNIVEQNLSKKVLTQEDKDSNTEDIFVIKQVLEADKCEGSQEKCNREKQTNFQCEECKKSFNYPFSLQRHTNIVYKKVQPFQCKICKKHFRLKHYLKEHTAQVHENRRPFQCEKCKKSLV
jgi:hypothetical protein